MQDYTPQPLDTSDVELTADLRQLIEQLARHVHEVWAQQRLADGWRYGARRDDGRKEHPCLVPYDELPESEKQYDRNTALQVLKGVLALGFQVTLKPQ
jgi:hypothetical protein